MFDDELVDGITGGLVSLDARVGELERKENPAIAGIGPFEYEVHVDIGGGGDYTSIAAAAAYVLATSNGVDYWTIVVHGGDYTEAAFTLPANATLDAVGNATIFATGVSGSFITLGDNCVVRNITVTLSMNPTAADCWAIECAGYLTMENCSIRVDRLGGSGSAFTIGVVKTETGDVSNSWLRLRVQESSYPGDRIIARFDDANPDQRSYLRDCTLGFVSDDPITDQASSTIYAETHLLWVIDCTIQKRSSGDAGYDIEAAAGATIYTSGTLWVKSLGTVTNLDVAAGAIGTVTSVGLTMPSIMSVAGSPVTTAGTLAVSLATQAANLVFAGPASGAAATPTFRALGIADGAVGLTTYAQGDILYASAANTLARLTAAAAGNVLLSGTTPTWGKVDLGVHVTGTLIDALHGNLSGGALHDNATVAAAGFMSAADKTRLDSLVGADGSGVAGRVTVWSDADTITSYTAFKWDDANETLLVGRATALTAAYSGFTGDDCTVLQLGQDTSANTSVKYGVLQFSHEQLGTTRVIGSIFWTNRAIVAAEKRTGLIEMRVGTTTNSGWMAFWTMDAGTLLERGRWTQGGALWVGNGAGTLTGAGDLDVTGNARIVGNYSGKLTLATATTITGGGTFALAGFTLTVPETLTVAGRNVANTFSAAQTISAAGTGLTVDNNARVSGALGIGVAPTLGKLHIKGSDSTAIRAYIENTDGTGVSDSIWINSAGEALALQMAGASKAGAIWGINWASLGRITNTAGALALGTDGAQPLYLATNSTVRATLPSAGGIVLGSGALATTATDGFLYIAGGAGAPTGVPTAFTGRVALYYDATNDRFYAYNGGWKSVALA